MVKRVRDDEDQLIARSQQGDIEAFNQLILSYQQTAYGAVYRLVGNADVAADITQDAFISAFRNIHSFRAGSSFRSWLLRIASNMACDHWRRMQRHPQESLDELTDEDELHSTSELSALVETNQEHNPEAVLLNQELQEVIQRGLQLLPLEQRVAVVLCDIQGFSYDEVAMATETSLGTVRSRIARGRARLRKYLDKYRELLPRQYRLPTNTD
jgi:RNA polymerase sigma-70 factor (ECF subfamily)